jgi:hypothetical protein
MAQARFRRVWLKIRDSLLLARKRAVAQAYSAPQQAAIRRYFGAAERRARAATELGDDKHLPVALALSAEAGRCYAAAIAISHDPSFDPGDLDAAILFGRIDALVAAAALDPPPDGYQAARATLTQHTRFAFDGLSAADMSASREMVEPTLKWLRGLVEPRTEAELRRAGVRRIVAAVAATIGGVLAVCWMSWLALRPPNVALYKPATVSSQWPSSPPAAGVTNGEFESTYGVSTTSEMNPWVRIDLEAVYRLSAITVYQRSDGHHAQGFPMCVEVSDNGTDWTEIGRRDAVSAENWTVSTKRRARYVRVRSIGARVLALTEIEVRGRE